MVAPFAPKGAGNGPGHFWGCECDWIGHGRTPEADARREARMHAEGYTVLRFTNADVLGETEGVVATIRAEIYRLQSERP